MTMRGVFEEMVKSYPGYLRDSSIAKAEVLEKSGHEKLKQASAGPWDMDNYCAMDELYDSGEKDIREAMVFRKIAEMADKVYNRMIWGAKWNVVASAESGKRKRNTQNAQGQRMD